MAQKINSKQNGGFWEELGRTTLASNGDALTVSSIPARKYLKVYYNLIPTGGNITATATFNGDTATNYSNRQAENGATDGSQVTQGGIYFDRAAAADTMWGRAEIINVANREKLVLGGVISSGAAGGGNIGARREFSGKWANTSAQISSITLTNASAGDFAIGSEMVVLGHD